MGFFIGNWSRLLWLPVGSEQMFAYSSPLTWLLQKLCLATLSNELGQGWKPIGFGSVPGTSFHSNDTPASKDFGYWPHCDRRIGYRCAAHISTGFSFLVMAVLFSTTSKDLHEWFTPHQHLLMTGSS
jgi:hypothetical protein